MIIVCTFYPYPLEIQYWYTINNLKLVRLLLRTSFFNSPFRRVVFSIKLQTLTTWPAAVEILIILISIPREQLNRYVNPKTFITIVHIWYNMKKWHVTKLVLSDKLTISIVLNIDSIGVSSLLFILFRRKCSSVFTVSRDARCRTIINKCTPLLTNQWKYHYVMVCRTANWCV